MSNLSGSLPRSSIYILLLLLVPVMAVAQVAGIAFLGAPQTVAPGSAASLTIEARDASDSATNGSTVCLTVMASGGAVASNVGALGSSSILQLTLSSNQYRRNFYYSNATRGTYTLTAHAFVRPAGTTCAKVASTTAQWSTSQNIVVGDPPPPPPKVTTTKSTTMAVRSAPPVLPQHATTLIQATTTVAQTEGGISIYMALAMLCALLAFGALGAWYLTQRPLAPQPVATHDESDEFEILS